jgi:hypothetical protein
MKSGYRQFFIGVAIFALAVSPARADYHYASHEGSDEYPYTSWETAAALIQDAVDVANPHDTVYIGAGEYNQQVVVDCDSLAIIGMGWDSTLVWYEDEDNPVMRLVPNMYYSVYFEGLHLQNPSGYWCMRGTPRNNLHVNLCKFSNPNNPLDGAGVITAAAPNEVIIENCMFDSLRTGFDDILGSNRAIVRNCIFIRFDDQAIVVYNDHTVIRNCIIANGAFNSMVAYGSSDSLLIYNNLVYDTYRAFKIGAGYAEITNNTIDLGHYTSVSAMVGGHYCLMSNNSVSNLRYFTYVTEGSYLWLAYNNFWNVENEVNIESGGELDTTGGNLRLNPMYTGNQDYHLQDFSPLIDAGNPALLDVDGSRSDIGFYGGPFGESYEYMDLPPLVPDSLSGYIIGDSIVISWLSNTEADFSNYLIYRDTVSGFEPDAFNLIAEPDTSYYSDIDWIPGNDYYYKIAAVDGQDNLSDYSEELAVITTGAEGGLGAEMPAITVIQSNYPNPFNSQTVIVYSVANLGPIPAQINIDIYDILGRKVRRLVDEKKEVGIHRVIWGGRDDSNIDLPSGVYFARIVQWDVDYMKRHQKLVLLR